MHTEDTYNDNDSRDPSEGAVLLGIDVQDEDGEGRNSFNIQIDSKTDVDEEEDLDKLGRGWFSCRRAEGNHILVFGKPRGRSFPAHCLMGPDWWCSIITLILIIVPSFAMFILAFPSVSNLTRLVGTSSFLVLVSSFTMTAFSDPGIIKRQTREQLERMEKVEVPTDGILCDICNIYRPSHAKHCYDCNACILEYDHHCPWTGKCIGKRTLYSFYVFLFSVFFHLIFVLIVMNSWLISSSRARRRG